MKKRTNQLNKSWSIFADESLRAIKNFLFIVAMGIAIASIMLIVEV